MRPSRKTGRAVTEPGTSPATVARPASPSRVNGETCDPGGAAWRTWGTGSIRGGSVTTNKQLVSDMYDAFLRGDIPFLLAQMSPTVEWEDWRGNNTAQNAGVAY